VAGDARVHELVAALAHPIGEVAGRLGDEAVGQEDGSPDVGVGYSGLLQTEN
jgi:hypothetical protein